MQAVEQEAALKDSASPIKAYSYDLHILDAVQDSQQVTCMTLKGLASCPTGGSYSKSGHL